jgi:DNA-binding transcriptional MerR regulator
MRISELVRRTGVPLATIKYYLREGLLMPGRATSATRAVYGEEHVRRLGLIRALVEVAGLPVQKAGVVIGHIEHPDGGLFETLGRAISALPPYVDVPEGAAFPRARAALEGLGQVYDPRFTAVAQLERALEAVEAAGVPMDDERLAVYGRHLRELAEFDIARIPRTSPEETIAYSVLGTALYEPVIAALRRLAHQDLAGRTLG